MKPIQISIFDPAGMKSIKDAPSHFAISFEACGFKCVL